ncbi:MAG: hypothetical protein WBV82_02585 [Myxococcaceae bacterium]
MRQLARTLLLLVGIPLIACGPTGSGLDGPVDAGQDGDGGSRSGECASEPVTEDVSACVPSATDYQPRSSADDSWPACISDDNQYHRIAESVSTIARVEAFDQIAGILWRSGRIPTPEDFIQARVLYAQDQGLDSRVQRREDIHYPAPAQDAKCADMGIPEQYPDRCVGPAKLLPILNESFAHGAQGQSPLLHARRIEAALLWFLYVSPLSEVTSCAAKPQDCDSAWAYYSGGTPRESPAGLAAYVAALGPETHHRAYDATLAVRCWRNLDNETGAASNLALRDQARAQLDRAMLRGMALIVRDRFAALHCDEASVAEAELAFLKVLVPLLDRASRERDPAHADVLLAQVSKDDPTQVDIEAAQTALDALYACP